jgi:predicted phage gp36 major capsid-like protein
VEIKDIIKIADDAYPDGAVGLAYEGRDAIVRAMQSCRPMQDIGDTLAVFIARELEETFAGGGTTKSQLEEAVRVMETAEEELSGVIVALMNARDAAS